MNSVGGAVVVLGKNFRDCLRQRRIFLHLKFLILRKGIKNWKKMARKNHLGNAMGSDVF